MNAHLTTTLVLALAGGIGLAAQGATSGQHNLKPGEVAMIGCLQRESDYRAQHNKGAGGPLKAGLGAGDEYVLAQAKPAPASGTGATQSATARDFSLTGRLEKDLVTQIGRMVEVVGTVKEGKDEIPKLTVSLAHPVGDFCPASPSK